MSYIIICTAALLVSGLTLFSGFGLGTLLMPAFALFFSLETAIAATAIVHLSNNIFKIFLVGKKADLRIVLKFALPAAIFAILGAFLLNYFITIEPITQYTLAGRTCTITAVKLIIASLMLTFALLKFLPAVKALSFAPKFIPLGGALSGLFGGISGHQGALRSAFLVNAGLTKEVFIGTVVMSAAIVDISRLAVYGATFFAKNFHIMKDEGVAGLVIAGTLAAFAGAFIGSRLVKKITMEIVQLIVGVMLVLIALGLGSGII